MRTKLLTPLATLAFLAVVAAVPVSAEADAPHPWYATGNEVTYSFPVESDATNASSGPGVAKEQQNPPDELASMSTPELVSAVLGHPDFYRCLAYSSYDEAITQMRQSFNGLDELLRRPDAGAALNSVYAQADLGEVAATDASAIIRFKYLELLLAQPEVLGSMDVGERKLLMANVVAKNEDKQKVEAGEYYFEDVDPVIYGRAWVANNPYEATAIESNSSLRQALRLDDAQGSAKLGDVIAALHQLSGWPSP